MRRSRECWSYWEYWEYWEYWVYRLADEAAYQLSLVARPLVGAISYASSEGAKER